MNEEEIRERMAASLKLAKESWEKASMPIILPGFPEETGKIALAILAKEIFKNLSQK